MSWDWQVAAHIATTFGFVITAVSLSLGYLRYRRSKRQEYVGELRKTIIDTKQAVDRLNDFIRSYDLSYDVVSNVAYSDTLAVTAKEVYTRFFDSTVTSQSQPDNSREALNTYLATEFPTIFVSIHTAMSESYSSITDTIRTEINRYQADYPALYRVLNSVMFQYLLVDLMYRTTARDENTWKATIQYIYDNYRDRINSHEELQSYCVMIMVSNMLQEQVAPVVLPDIQDCSKILDLVTVAYMSKSDRKLISLRKKEQKEQYDPIPRTTIEEDLKQAENGLRWILPQVELLTYNDLVLSFTSRQQQRRALITPAT